MNLTSDLPFWTVRNGLLRVYAPLTSDIHSEALVIGGGISGALLAHQLVRQGVDCVLLDRRDIGHGSTSASTALLQYEIDTPLHRLRKTAGRDAADRAYNLGVEAIPNLQKLAGKDCGFAYRPSLQIATRAADIGGLEREYRARRELRLRVTLMDQGALRAIGIEGKAGLRSAVAGEVDPYRLTHRLLHLACKDGLRVFDRTAAVSYKHSARNVTVKTDRGPQVRCNSIFFATGYEAREILPKNIVSFRSTYALISEPLADLSWWKDRCLIWGTGDAYPYMRTTSDKRILVGGEDDDVLDPGPRDRQLPRKMKTLVRRFHAHFPDVAIEPAFGWAGVFGSTKDGLAYIGAHPSFARAYFALGFGGNGITFSAIASQILTDMFLGKKNADEKVFSFGRPNSGGN